MDHETGWQGSLIFHPALSRPGLLAPPVFAALRAWPGAGEVRVAATTRADVNGLVRRHLGARKASFGPVDAVTAATGMEYGGITPIGLPPGWPVLVDAAVGKLGNAVIGSGIRGSKLWLPGRLLESVPGAEVLAGLGV